jgi:hypothetical protein
MGTYFNLAMSLEDMIRAKTPGTSNSGFFIAREGWSTHFFVVFEVLSCARIDLYLPMVPSNTLGFWRTLFQSST